MIKSGKIQHYRYAEEIASGLKFNDPVVTVNNIFDRLRTDSHAGVLHRAESSFFILFGNHLICIVDRKGKSVLGSLPPHIDPALAGAQPRAGLHGILQKIAEEDAQIGLGDLDILRDSQIHFVFNIIFFGFSVWQSRAELR